MASLNKVLLMGNLTRDPELRYTPQGKPVATFSVACNRVWKDADGERQEETQWFRIQCWNRLSEIATQYLRKGSKVYLEGRLSIRQYTGQDNLVHISCDVTATELQMLDRKADGDDERPAAGATERAPAELVEDAIPF